jgi:hypothetical protein
MNGHPRDASLMVRKKGLRVAAEVALAGLLAPEPEPVAVEFGQQVLAMLRAHNQREKRKRAELRQREQAN